MEDARIRDGSLAILEAISRAPFDTSKVRSRSNLAEADEDGWVEIRRESVVSMGGWRMDGRLGKDANYAGGVCWARSDASHLLMS
eukprot:CAMPEP_0206458404 /NCGR_PEP_ID=MMETSP0324_2-20121206/23548_1 /ASSEMBLY_ACC=CAM_ASM_000836 /TAXON_ID=2866 /ORGANISM="Crypthecodinium cohnii, Strain Seligo" /LENGTH=84 /DNA_ID=CAMNT_0053929733 /DNA_START=405 /DNA_END=659 /DNA_ORIENTATION=+